MRLFICTLLSTENQAFYGHHVNDLVARSGGVLRAIPGSSAHLTYAFLGKTDERELDRVLQAVRASGDRCGSIRIRLGAPSVLYARATPRLVCASVIDGQVQLQHLATEVVAELEHRCPNVGVDRSRSLHVTLARFRSHTTRAAARAISGALAGDALATTTRDDWVTRVQVVSSDLTPGGPVYTVNAEIALKGGA
jgi:2'-5' RNA ligase